MAQGNPSLVRGYCPIAFSDSCIYFFRTKPHSVRDSLFTFNHFSQEVIFQGLVATDFLEGHGPFRWENATYLDVYERDPVVINGQYIHRLEPPRCQPNNQAEDSLRHSGDTVSLQVGDELHYLYLEPSFCIQTMGYFSDSIFFAYQNGANGRDRLLFWNPHNIDCPKFDRENDGSSASCLLITSRTNGQPFFLVQDAEQDSLIWLNYFCGCELKTVSLNLGMTFYNSLCYYDPITDHLAVTYTVTPSGYLTDLTIYVIICRHCSLVNRNSTAPQRKKCLIQGNSTSV